MTVDPNVDINIKNIFTVTSKKCQIYSKRVNIPATLCVCTCYVAVFRVFVAFPGRGTGGVKRVL